MISKQHGSYSPFAPAPSSSHRSSPANMCTSCSVLADFAAVSFGPGYQPCHSKEESCADTLPVSNQKLPALTANILKSIIFPHQQLRVFHAATDVAQTLRQAGWQPPDWAHRDNQQTSLCPTLWINPWQTAAGNTARQRPSTTGAALSLNRCFFRSCHLRRPFEPWSNVKLAPFVSRAFATI